MSLGGLAGCELLTTEVVTCDRHFSTLLTCSAMDDSPAGGGRGGTGRGFVGGKDRRGGKDRCPLLCLDNSSPAFDPNL
jgi:hypothetical protein